MDPASSQDPCASFEWIVRTPHVSSKRYALQRLVHLVEGVTHNRGFVEGQLWIQRLRKIQAHLLSGLSELHLVSSKRYALH